MSTSGAPADDAGCCGPAHSCVFAKALLAHAASCECAERRPVAERLLVDCRRPVAHANCHTLWRLLHERARFALRLPPEGQPMMHAQALRLQCGGLAALQQTLGAAHRDAHRLVAEAQQAHGRLADLPWDQLVPVLAAWALPRRRSAAPPAP